MFKVRKFNIYILLFLLVSCQSNPLLEYESESKLVSESELITKDVDRNQVYYEDFNVALILPLTGSKSENGQSILNSSLMSLYEHINPRIKIYNFDSYSNNAGAVVAVKQSLRINPDLIITVYSDETEAIYPIAEKHNIPIITLSNNKEISRDNLFVLGFLPDQNVEQITKWALDKNFTKFAAILPQNKYGYIVKESYEKSLDNNNMLPNIKMLDISFNIKIDDFKSALDNIYDYSMGGDIAVLIPENFLRNQRVFEISKKYNNIHYLLINQSDDMYETYAKNKMKITFASGNLNIYNSFNKDYKKNFNKDIQRNNTIAYDIISMIDIMLNHYPEMSFNEFIHRIELQGIDGVLTINENNTAYRKFEIYSIVDGKFINENE